jgi:hypothetical protein
LASLVVVVGHPANAPATGSDEHGLPVSPLVLVCPVEASAVFAVGHPANETVFRLLSLFPASL